MNLRYFRFGLLLSILVVTALTNLCLSQDATSESSIKPLFDGKSFDGWEGDTKSVWRIEDSALTAGSLSTQQEKNDFLATTKPYSDFELSRRRTKVRVRVRSDNIHLLSAQLHSLHCCPLRRRNLPLATRLRPTTHPSACTGMQ